MVMPVLHISPLGSDLWQMGPLPFDVFWSDVAVYIWRGPVLHLEDGYRANIKAVGTPSAFWLFYIDLHNNTTKWIYLICYINIAVFLEELEGA
jgi:hypothetical protein